LSEKLNPKLTAAKAKVKQIPAVDKLLFTVLIRFPYAVRERGLRLVREMRLALASIVVLLSCAAAMPQAAKPSLQFRNVGGPYRSFAEIEPVLINDSDFSVFLWKVYPYYEAHLSRFNEGTETWEPGAQGIACGTVEKPDEPIEIKAGEERRVRLAWELSTDDLKRPSAFELPDGTLRPLVGKYRLGIRYALEPWILGKNPLRKFIAFSDFEIVK
jgi:hypothetical protein